MRAAHRGSNTTLSQGTDDKNADHDEQPVFEICPFARGIQAAWSPRNDGPGVGSSVATLSVLVAPSSEQRQLVRGQLRKLLSGRDRIRNRQVQGTVYFRELRCLCLGDC
jgi:hypothetical protein